MKLTDDVYAYVWQGQGNNCNTYLLKYADEGKTKYVMVDPGLVMADPFGTGEFTEPALATVLESMKCDGIDVRDVGFIFNTHGHGDHAGASLDVRRMCGAPMAMHRADLDIYEMKVARAHRGIRLTSEDIAHDIYLEEGVLDLGKPAGISLEVIRTPGHTPGSVSLWWAEKKVLVVGDTIFYRSVGRTDGPGGDSAELVKSVNRLASIDAECVLTGHPYGHPGVIVGAQEVRRNFDMVVRRVLPMLFV
ncbi:MAG: MBL fold metallo-hydrolase [Chloroflexi bacterium]|nr:MBL fold metallo-hydrolase [Chloroflexota bacterium]